MKINCGGKMFITTAHSLSHYPDTLLGDKTVSTLQLEMTKQTFAKNDGFLNVIRGFVAQSKDTL